ncbi:MULTISPECIES: TetR/AcrR family transcriptional regulator [Streptomyces]|uniref:TetR/AcrR family transcriptional regulator n=1 Tax=Streptomyces TaxID=1883 RepID=UPI001587564B|nr:TetR/AcrR family transcriptional regulator [Streptomyces sp. CAI-85]MBO7936694.1 TetR/AcrR family transcriptional regulator [Streptomyces sp. S9]NUV61104.1 TetR/AcrR family transcriptional regulator [Streptomyces sp. CAI-85]
MSEHGSSRAGTRFERRRAQTRRSLIAAARVILAEENALPETSIQKIAEQADVGFGSFFNHFDSKAALFDAAVADALEEYGQLLDDVTAELDDPAEVIAANVRLTIGMVETHPELAKILRHRGMAQMHSESGLAPRALRDIEIGVASGRFAVDSPDITLSAVGGALLGLLELESRHPEVAGPETSERTAALVLRMLGLSPEDADDVARRPLPQAPAARA